MNIDSSLRELRRDYNAPILDISELDKNPIVQFKNWLDLAIASSGEIEANAMSLSTVDKSGNPSVRIVLLKEILDGQFVFFTNYESAKGNDLAENSNCALGFWWPKLQKQVCITGRASKTSEEYSTDYFRSRPLGSQLGAIASPQSRIINNRKQLDDRVSELEKKYSDNNLPEKPAHWGGYKIKPVTFHFWQGQTNRLHDRFQYRIVDQEWIIERLAP